LKSCFAAHSFLNRLFIPKFACAIRSACRVYAKYWLNKCRITSWIINASPYVRINKRNQCTKIVHWWYWQRLVPY
jgi:hypothetical protein